MGIAGLIVLPILMLLGKSIIAKIYAFSFWFQRIILPERDAPQPIDTPQTAQDVEKLLDTPWWDAFWAYQNRSFRLAFIIEAAVAFLFFFLLNLSIGSMEDTFKYEGYHWKSVFGYSFMLTAIPALCFFMQYRSERKTVQDWKNNYKFKLISEKDEAIVFVGQEYAKFVNHDRSQNKRVRRKMLRIVAGAVAVLLCLVGVTQYISRNVDKKLGDNAYEFRGFEYTLQEDGTARIDRYVGRVPAELVLPAELHGVPVTSIGKKAFAEQPRIVQVTVPEGVTTIGEKAFYFCEKLERVILPQSLETIEPRAFSDCWKATQIDLPAGLKHIGKHAFSSCYMLSAVSIPESVETIGEWAFSGTNIKEITIPASVDSLGTGAFSNCLELTRVTILNGSLELDGRSFRGCTSLVEVDLPVDAAVIPRDMALFSADGKRLITYWGKATAYAVPDGVEEICDYAFSSCKTLKSVSFPKGLRRIGKSAFEGCGLEQIDLPGGLRELGVDAFSGCSSLTDIVLPDGLIKVDISSFPVPYNTNMTITIPPSVRKLDWSGAWYREIDRITFRVVRGSAADAYLKELENKTSWNGEKVFNPVQIQYYVPQVEKKAAP